MKRIVAAAIVLTIGALVVAGHAAPSTQEASKAPSVTTLVASPSPSVETQQVTLSVTVKPRETSADVPAGAVEFFDAASSLGLVPLVDAGDGPAASLTVKLSVGPHPLSATYKGDARFDVSISPPLLHIVNKP